MFIRFSTVLPIAALAAVVSAAPSSLEARGGSQCSTGPIQCCNSVQQGNPTSVALLSSLLGLNLPNVEGLIGLTCNPISVLGVGGNSCNSQAVCCTNNQFNGLINLGCTPVNLNL